MNPNELAYQKNFEQQLKIMRFFESLIVFAFTSVINTILYIGSLMLITFTTFLLSFILWLIGLQACAASVFNFLMLTLFVIAHLNPVFLIISLSIILLASLAMTYMFLKEPEKNTTAKDESIPQKEEGFLKKLSTITTSFFAEKGKESSGNSSHTLA
jgi:hypothetical protein